VDHLVAYVDDSGDSHAAALAAVVVRADQWLGVLDHMVRFRRRLSAELGIRMARELKATDLVSGGGPWRTTATPIRTRFGVYKRALQLLDTMPEQVWVMAAVVPDRNALDEPPASRLWELLLERLERLTKAEDATCLLVPDDGNTRTVRSIARRRRRVAFAPSAYGTSGLKRPFGRLVEDPVFRDSKDSYLTQWADLVAYASFRAVVPRPTVPAKLWESLGGAINERANATERRRAACDEPPGLIIWPDRHRPA
jgi:hypothetical protein